MLKRILNKFFPYKNRKGKEKPEERQVLILPRNGKESIQISEGGLTGLSFEEFHTLLSGKYKFTLEDHKLILQTIKNSKFSSSQKSQLLAQMNRSSREVSEANVDLILPAPLSETMEEVGDKISLALEYISTDNPLKLKLNFQRKTDYRSLNFIATYSARIVRVMKRKYISREGKSIAPNFVNQEFNSVERLLKSRNFDNHFLQNFIFPEPYFIGDENYSKKHKSKIETRKREIREFYSFKLNGKELSISKGNRNNIAILEALIQYHDWLLDKIEKENTKKTNISLDQAIIESASSLQENIKILIDSGFDKENSRNKFISNELEKWGYIAKDKSQMGSSRAGKTIGEIDIKICNMNGSTIAIAEGLILSYLNSSDIIKHVNGLFKYDKAGLEKNYILIYAEKSNFLEFWGQYKQFVSTEKFDLEIINTEDIDTSYTNIKAISVTYLRNSSETSVLHIFIDTT